MVATRSMASPEKSQAKGEAPKFLIGTAISVYQNSGDINSQWDHFVGRRWFYDTLPTISNGDTIGKSCDFWNRFEEDLALARDIGSNAFRFSIEWSKIEPRRGEIDKASVARYHQIISCIKKNGMEPLATLHHFVHPQWYEELGAFEKEENISLFLDYVRLAYKEFGSQITSWCTFNEPGVYTFSGYCMGSFPPGKHFHFGLAGRVLKHLMISHTEAYKLIKSMPGGETAQVGIVHNYMPFEARAGKWWLLIWWNRALAALCNHTWGNDTILDFLGTGVLNWRPLGPLFCRVSYSCPHGRPPLDWVGLNYYSRVVLDWKLTPTVYNYEKESDLHQSIYPQGFYDAIRKFARLKRPVYVTETGIADKSDKLRAEWAETYFRALEHAVADGYDVRGLMYWTLIDNFEWAFGWAPRFGLFEWEHTKDSQERTERESTKTTIRRLFRELPAKVEEMWSDGLRHSVRASTLSQDGAPKPIGQLTPA
ncbi:6-phospho-beta-galactosidase [Coccomyxa sp. Obi]|nr:6-phospho-beta-galactosidase [Coccomyxa sp. Obi]